MTDKLAGKRGGAASRLYVIVYAKEEKRKIKRALRPKKIPAFRQSSEQHPIC